jgi:hypothetical protein
MNTNVVLILVFVLCLLIFLQLIGFINIST